MEVEHFPTDDWEGSHFSDWDCPELLVAYHPRTPSPLFAGRVQADLVVHGIAALCEPGFVLQAASTGGTQSSLPASVNFDATHLASTRRALPPRGRYQSAAVIDSGDWLQHASMLEFSAGKFQTTSASDDYGHGMGVAELIRSLTRKRTIESIRILDAYGNTESHLAILAFIYCCWSGKYDVVNASFSTAVARGCASTLGTSFEYLLAMSSTTFTPPKIIAAAGNSPAQVLDCPAKLAGVEVAVADDWLGQPATYNVQPPAPVTPTRAYGGTRSDPFGDLISSTGVKRDMWGTSYAAAVVTASYLQ